MQNQLTVGATIKHKEALKVMINSESCKVNGNKQDYAVQALTYLYEASAKLAISNTLLSLQEDVNPSILEQLRTIQISLNEFESNICQLTK